MASHEHLQRTRAGCSTTQQAKAPPAQPAPAQLACVPCLLLQRHGHELLVALSRQNILQPLKGERATCRSARRAAALQIGADAAAAELRHHLSELRFAMLQQMAGRIVDDNRENMMARLWHSQGTLVQQCC